MDLQRRDMGTHRSQPPAVPNGTALRVYSTDHPSVAYGTPLANTNHHVMDDFRQVGAEDGFRNLIGYEENMPLPCAAPIASFLEIVLTITTGLVPLSKRF